MSELEIATIPPDAAESAANAAGVTPRSTWNFSADNINIATSHYTPEARELLRWCFAWCIDPKHSIRRDEFARRVGYSDNVVFKVYTGTYRNPQTGELMQVPEKLMRGMAEFRRVELEREQLGSTQFVMTPTAREIFDHYDLIRESQTPGFLYGSSQQGKTVDTLRYCQLRNHGNTPYIRLGAASGLHGMLSSIAAAVGVSPKSSSNALIPRIKNAVTPQMLLCLDEAHQLIYTYRQESFWACVEVLREIYDATQCGMVLIMTNLGRDKFERARRQELEQMFRRTVHVLDLGTMPKIEDIQAILGAWGLDWPDKKDVVQIEGQTEQPWAMLHQLAKNDGLKAIVERLRYGRKIAGTRPLSWEAVCEAHLILKAKATAPEPW